MLPYGSSFTGAFGVLPPWDCGYRTLATPACRIPRKASGNRSAISSASFSRSERDLPSPIYRVPRYRVSVYDRLWQRVYLPLAVRSYNVSRTHFAWLQQGPIAIYLLYSFMTFLALLVLVL